MFVWCRLRKAPYGNLIISVKNVNSVILVFILIDICSFDPFDVRSAWFLAKLNFLSSGFKFFHYLRRVLRKSKCVGICRQTILKLHLALEKHYRALSDSVGCATVSDLITVANNKDARARVLIDLCCSSLTAFPMARRQRTMCSRETYIYIICIPAGFGGFLSWMIKSTAYCLWSQTANNIYNFLYKRSHAHVHVVYRVK